MAPPDEEPLPATLEELRARLELERGKLRAMQDIAQALGSTLDLDELMGLLLARIARIMESDQATLFVVNEASSDLSSRHTHGGRAHELRLRIGQGLPGWVAKNGRALNVKDAYLDVRFDAEGDRRTGYRTSSALCVPVKNHQLTTIGVLQVLNKRSGYFTLDDESMFAALASQVAVALENSKLFLSVVGKNIELLDIKDQLEHKVRELDVLFEIAQVSASAVRLDDVLEGVLARAMHAIDAEAGSILLSDEQTGDLRFRCAVGGDPDGVRRLTIASEQGICGWVASHGQPQVVNDVAADARHSQAIADQVGYHPRSLLCVPLSLTDGRGALELLNKAHGRGSFTDDDLRLAMLIAGHVSTAIDLAQTRQRREQEERLSTIGQLLSGVVHDLRGPMTVISGYARLLEDEHDDAQRAAYGEAILRQVEAVNAMTGEILAFARGATNLLVSKVYLKPFFAELADHLKLKLEGRHVELSLQLTDRGVAFFDQHKIRRAVHNLVRNAAQAIGQSGGHVVLTVERTSEGSLAIRCADDGPGVPEEIRHRVFDSFTTHGKPEGTGLGLAIVRKVAADHGGKVELNSRPGETVFTLTLPPGSLEGQHVAAAVDRGRYAGECMRKNSFGLGAVTAALWLWASVAWGQEAESAQDMGQGEARINVRSDVKMAIKGTRGTTSANLQQLTDTVADQMPGMRQCYRELIAKRPTTVGSLAIRLTLDAAPAKPVIELKQMGVSDEGLIKCVNKVLEKAPLGKVGRPAAAIVTLDVSNTRAAGEAEMQERIATEEKVEARDDGAGGFVAEWATTDGQIGFVVHGQGSRDAVEATVRGLRASFASLLDCRRRARKGDLSPAGEVRVGLRLSRGGEASAKLVSSTVAHERAGTCSERMLGRMKFEGAPPGKQVEVTVKFAP